MKNKLNEEKIRMAKLAGILNENNDSDVDVQVWFDMDGVLADFDKSIESDEEVIAYKKELDDLIFFKARSIIKIQHFPTDLLFAY